jgi:hypothetical protein
MSDRPEVVVQKLPDGSTSVRGPGESWIVVSARSHDVMYMRAGGFLMGEMMTRALAALDKVVGKDGQFTLVVDAEAQTGYEPAVRAAITEWLDNHASQVRPCHLLAPAPLVRMGAEMINMALNRKLLHMYRERGEFERSVARVVRDSERMRAARPLR